MEELFAALFRLAEQGRVDARGLPDPFQAALLMREFPDEFFYLPGIPVAVQQALAAPLAAIARRRGGRAPR